MKIYKQLAKIAERLAKESEGKDVAYFNSYKKDLYEIDKDILANDSQAGDTYIWAVKANGCGTFMVRCQGDQESYTLKEAGDNSKFFRLRCTGINEGTVEEISYKQALRAYKDYPEPAGRVGRRRYMYEQLNQLLGLDESTGRLEHTLMGSEFSPKDGDRSVIKVSGSGTWLKIDVVRPKISPPREHEVLCQKPSHFYYATKSYTGGNLVADGPKYFLLESQQDGYAKVTEASQRMFTIAQKTVEKSLEIEGDSQMSY